MPYSLLLAALSGALFFEASTTIYFTEINFHEFKFRLDQFSRVWRFFSKSTKICLNEVCNFSLSVKNDPREIFVKIGI